ncbi:MAG: hypothetical protein R3B09_30155 [Nannocystaceae bacterium]
MDSASRSLAFLFSFGALPLACTAGDDMGTSDTATGTTGTAGTTTAGTTDGTSTDATGTATMGETVGTTAGTSTDGTSTEGTTTATTDGTTGDVDDACASYWSKEAECYPRYASELDAYIAECKSFLMSLGEVFGEDCIDAQAAVYKCYGGLTCAELMDATACDAVAEAADMTCVVTPGPACTAFGEKKAMCDPRLDAAEVAEYCQTEIGYGTITSGRACGDAIEEHYACLSALSCAELESPDACADVDTSACVSP